MSFDMYSENILDHFKYPDHKGEIKNADAQASDANVTCGDKITFYFQIKPATPKTAQSAQNGTKAPVGGKKVGSRQTEQTQADKWAGSVQNASFSGVGCAISQSSADILAEMLIGKTVKQALAVNRQDVLDALGTPISATRTKCALLGLKVSKLALYDYVGEKPASEATLEA